MTWRTRATALGLDGLPVYELRARLSALTGKAATSNDADSLARAIVKKLAALDAAWLAEVGPPLETCAVCGRTKVPLGRSASPAGDRHCDWDCTGYHEPRRPGSLWPGERRQDFGFPPIPSDQYFEQYPPTEAAVDAPAPYVAGTEAVPEPSALAAATTGGAGGDGVLVTVARIAESLPVDDAADAEAMASVRALSLGAASVALVEAEPAGPPDGVVRGMPAAEYHALDRVSSSILKRWLRCAAVGLHEEDVAGPDVDIGTAVHALVECPAWEPVVADCATRRGKAWDDAVALVGATGGDALALTAGEWERARATFAAVTTNRFAMRRIELLEHELSFLWSDGETHAKARADLFGRGFLVDLKTTGDVRALGDDAAVARLVLDRLWHLQLAWYRQGAVACGESVDRCEVILATSKPPHVCEVVTLDETFLDLGSRAWREALDTLLRHRRDPSRWPGPSCDAEGSPTIRTIQPPRWAL